MESNLSLNMFYRRATVTRISIDYTDKTSWFYDSALSTDEVLSDSGDGLTFDSNNLNWIDLDKISDRDILDSSYNPVIKINDVIQNSNYTINFANGTVTFDSDQSSNSIKATYRYAQTSEFILTPPSNQKWILLNATGQFVEGNNFNDAMIFSAILNNSSTSNQDYVVGKVTYKNAVDMISRADSIYQYPPFGGMTSTKQGVLISWEWQKRSPYIIFPVGHNVNPGYKEFNKLSFKLETDTPITGTDFATATFYMITEKI